MSEDELIGQIRRGTVDLNDALLINSLQRAYFWW